MKTLSSRHLALFLAACALVLTSCRAPYDHRSYVRGTGHGIDREPVPKHVIVEEPDGNVITSGYSNRDSFYYGKRYYKNRYYGGMFYGYNNPAVAYTSGPSPDGHGQTTYLFQPLSSWSY